MIFASEMRKDELFLFIYQSNGRFFFWCYICIVKYKQLFLIIKNLRKRSRNILSITTQCCIFHWYVPIQSIVYPDLVRKLVIYTVQGRDTLSPRGFDASMHSLYHHSTRGYIPAGTSPHRHRILRGWIHSFSPDTASPCFSQATHREQSVLRR